MMKGIQLQLIWFLCGAFFNPAIARINDPSKFPPRLRRQRKGNKKVHADVPHNNNTKRTLLDHNGSFERQVIQQFPAGKQPMHLTPLPDGRIVYSIRDGDLRVYNPATSSDVLAATLPVTVAFEDGLLGVIADPNFSTNNFLYLYWSPSSGPSVNLLSRFVLLDDYLDLASRRDILSVPVQRENCCHSGGALAFDSLGNLYISTGDNTDSFDSDGYNPIDERPGRQHWDAQRTAANTNDLRGKILRIRPTYTPNTPYYTVPENNMFPLGTAQTRSEIYVMGLRNPFRMAVDPDTDMLYIGDVGPDAFEEDPKRGPKGYDVVLTVPKDTPRNFGWPYCRANNQAYVDYDYASGTSGDAFVCSNLQNLSPNNNGLQSLPPAHPATIWYTYQISPEFPELDSSIWGSTAIAAHVYRPSQITNPSAEFQLPDSYDGSLIFAEWSRDYVREMKFDAAGNLLEINPLWSGESFRHPIDLTVSPTDGSLYLLEFGIDYTGTGAQMSQIRYVPTQETPVCVLLANPTSGNAPLTVSFVGFNSHDPNNDPLSFAWDFDDDGTVDSTAPDPVFTYNSNGEYSAKLVVTDDQNNAASCSQRIISGNQEPVITLTSPFQHGVFAWGSQVYASVEVQDSEDGSTTDGSIPCSAVTLTPGIGHDLHVHDALPTNGCDIVWEPMKENSVGEFYSVLSAKYTDQGAPGTASISKRLTVRFQGSFFEAENYHDQFGTEIEATTNDSSGGFRHVGYIQHGDWLSYKDWNLHFIDSVVLRLASEDMDSKGFVDIRRDSIDGEVLASVPIPGTGGWQNWADVGAPIADTNQWFEIDLGVMQVLQTIQLDSGTSSHMENYPRGYVVYIANALGTNGKPDYGYANDYFARGHGTDAIVEIVFPEVVLARYVKIYQTGESASHWWSIAELNIQDDTSTPLDRTLWTFIASSTEPNSSLTNVKDGNLESVWSNGRLQSSGSATLFFVFRSTESTAEQDLCNFNYFNFIGRGISSPIMGAVLDPSLMTTPLPAPTTAPQQPPLGGAIMVPGRMEAEQHVAALDTTAGDSGNSFCTLNSDVDLEPTSDIGGGCNVGWIESGEWLEFIVDFSVAGYYDIAFRVASEESGTKSLHLEIDSVDVTGPVTFESTGGWQSWITVSVMSNVMISEGSHSVRVLFDAGVFNLNYIDWTTLIMTPEDGRTSEPTASPLSITNSPLAGPTSAPPSLAPSTMPPAAPTSIPVAAIVLPGRMEAEQHSAALDNTIGDSGDSEECSRNNNVDIQPTSDRGGGCNVGWIESGEWLEFVVDVSVQGHYDIAFRVATEHSGTKSLHLEIDSVDITGPVTFESTGGWQNWITVSVMTNKLIRKGIHSVRVVFDVGVFNLNYIDWTTLIMTPEDGPTSEPTASPLSLTNSPTSEPTSSPLSVTNSPTSETTASPSSVTNPPTSETTASPLSVTNSPMFETTASPLSVTNSPTSETTSSPLSKTNSPTSETTSSPLSKTNSPTAELTPAPSSLAPSPIPPAAPTSIPVAAIVLPGRMEAEHHSAALDNTIGDSGDSVKCTRNNNVDIQPTSDIGGGCNVGWIESGEWLEFIVDFSVEGYYDIAFRVASEFNGTKSLHVEIDSVNITDPVTFESTGGWQNWITVSVMSKVVIRKGMDTVVRVVFDSGVFNLNYIDWTLIVVADDENSPTSEPTPWSSSVTTTPPPLYPTVWTAPGRIEAESYSRYYDLSEGDYGTEYSMNCTRNDNVDIGITSDLGGGCYVGWIESGEWLEWEIDFEEEESKIYTVELRVASTEPVVGQPPETGDKSCYITVDGDDVTGTITFNATTGNWDVFTTVTATTNTPISSGQHTVRLWMTSSLWNINYMDWI